LKSKLGARLAVGRDAARVIISGPRYEAWAEDCEYARLRRLDDVAAILLSSHVSPGSPHPFVTVAFKA
jgi:hypothetical protein